MSLLTLNIASCVRVTNKFSECRECEKYCPVETITIDEQSVSFVPNDCVGCGGCLAVCPTDAYSLDDFSATSFVFSHLQSGKNIISCKSDPIPCLAALSVEEMVSLTILSGNDVLFEKIHCAECSIADMNLELIEDRVEESNFILEALGVDREIVFDDFSSPKKVDEIDEENLSRRDFLSKANIKDVAVAKHKFENKVKSLNEELQQHSVSTEDIKSIRAKKLPDRRKLLSMAINRLDKPEMFHKLDINDISFISQKVIDEDSCTNCQMCYRICPTGALSSNEHGAFIAFSAIECVKCSSCHDVCEPNSITLKSVFDVEQLFKPKKEMLIKFSIRRCDECGMPFAYRGGEVMCNRCRIEVQEALSLWGIK